MLRNNVGLSFITETWLKSSIAVSVIDIPGYSVLRRDRSSYHQDGVCLYINTAIRYKRLPRGFSFLLVAVVYHPHWSAAEDEFMQEHLFQSLQLVESRFPDCALIVAGIFYLLNTRPIERLLRLKQIVKIPTRKDPMLDLHRFYDVPQGFPPFGVSDHNVITMEAKVRDNCRQQSRFVLKRDQGGK